jgi:repressor LexA
MAGKSGELFALKVKGDSMIGDNIADGDIIVVRSQQTAKNGEIVAALIEEEATIKRLDIRTQPPRLLASNPNYSPIELTPGTTRILGKVVGLIRSY